LCIIYASNCYFEFVLVISNGVNDSINTLVLFKEKEQPKLVELVDGKFGKEYELVVVRFFMSLFMLSGWVPLYYASEFLHNMSMVVAQRCGL
jgi:hypothetical protein